MADQKQGCVGHKLMRNEDKENNMENQTIKKRTILNSKNKHENGLNTIAGQTEQRAGKAMKSNKYRRYFDKLLNKSGAKRKILGSLLQLNLRLIDNLN